SGNLLLERVECPRRALQMWLYSSCGGGPFRGLFELLKPGNFRLGLWLVAEPVINSAEQVMWVCVVRRQRNGCLERIQGILIPTLHLEHPAELIMRLWEPLVITDRRTQILFRLG